MNFTKPTLLLIQAFLSNNGFDTEHVLDIDQNIFECIKYHPCLFDIFIPYPSYFVWGDSKVITICCHY